MEKGVIIHQFSKFHKSTVTTRKDSLSRETFSHSFKNPEFFICNALVPSFPSLWVTQSIDIQAQ